MSQLMLHAEEAVQLPTSWSGVMEGSIIHDSIQQLLLPEHLLPRHLTPQKNEPALFTLLSCDSAVWNREDRVLLAI